LQADNLDHRKTLHQDGQLLQADCTVLRQQFDENGLPMSGMKKIRVKPLERQREQDTNQRARENTDHHGQANDEIQNRNAFKTFSGKSPEGRAA
jgi:hypothetical protein